VTTHSLLLTKRDVKKMSTALGFQGSDVTFKSLQEFDTEHQFCQVLKLVLLE
jgi:hypothetical protein